MQVLKPHYRTQECVQLITEVLESGWTGPGPMTERFEKAWKHYAMMDNALMVSSATAGLHLALECLKDGRTEVITTPLTFVSTNHAIIHAGLVPVFADVDASLNMDPASVEALIGPDTLAVVFVGIGGNARNYAEIRKLCDRHGVYLVMDGAHMAGTMSPRVFHGVIIADSQVGWDADVAVFSFQAVKNLPTADSGMVCFADDKKHERAKRLSWMGIDKSTYTRNQGGYTWEYDVPEVGWKYNGNAVMASLGIVGLRYLDHDNAHRRQVAQWYGDVLIPHLPGSSRHLCQVVVDDRDAVMARLTAHGIGTGVHYKINTRYPMYEGDFPVAERLSERILSLPCHMGVTQEDVERVCALLY